MRFLLIQPYGCHGHLIFSLIDELERLGHTAAVAVPASHPDREALQRLPWPVQLVDFSSWPSALRWCAGITGFQAGILITAGPQLMPLHCWLAVRLPLHVMVHDISAYPNAGRRSWLLRRLARQLVVLAPELSSGPVYFPLLGDTGRDELPERAGCVLLVPGAVDPRRRDYRGLLRVLQEWQGPAPFRVRLLGSRRDSDPGLVRSFEELPAVDVDLSHWIDDRVLAREMAGCHYILPLLDRPRCAFYMTKSAATSLFWAHGLPRPILLDEEVPLDGATAPPGIRYRPGQLGPAMLQASQDVASGEWTAHMARAFQLRASLRARFPFA